jgi:hypothetical protein
MLRKVKKRDRAVSINMAYCISRLAGVPFDDVVTGKYPIKGTASMHFTTPGDPTA